MNHRILKRNRDRLSRETGPHTFIEGGDFRVCLVYPNTYHVGMSNLGLQVNLAAISGIPGVTVERAFLPDEDQRSFVDGRRVPLCSLETGRPLTGFQVLAFSITYELDYINVVRILGLAGIEPLKGRRGTGDPLILAGGAAVTANPFSVEEIFDLFWIGESEAGVVPFFTAIKEGYGSPSLLDSLGRMEHVHVPGTSEYGQVVSSIHQFDLDLHPAASHVITPDTAFSSTGLMEVTRGCKWPCRFCIARTLYGTVRKLSREVVVRRALDFAPYTGKLGLFGAGISDYPDLTGLIQELADLEFVVNVSSLRIAALTPELLAALDAAGQRTITVAPESFSLRILKKLAKGLNEVYLHRGLENLLASRIERIKVYHILGVPEEEEEDLAKTVEFLAPYSRRGKRILWEIGYSILEPKPHTPFENLEMASKCDVEKSLKFVRKSIPQLGRVKLTLPSFRETYLCDWLCRGTPRVAVRLVEALAGDPWAPFQIPYHEYLHDMETVLSTRQPWMMLPEDPRQKDGKQVLAHPVAPRLPVVSA